MSPDELKEDLKNALLEHSSSCIAMSQLYKMLCDEIDVKNYILIYLDGASLHAFNMIDRSNRWSFADAVRGILRTDEDDINMDYGYDHLEDKKYGTQKILGVFPPEIYDKLLKKTVQEGSSLLEKNKDGLYDIPKEFIIEGPSRII
jgi:hypothetical protein